ncbi:MAG: MarR family transcriptional regulator [Chloroflexota bacterium]|jgi:DNA-binding MarR family transcriptional regulator
MSEIKEQFLDVCEKTMGQFMARSMRSFWQFAKEQGLTMTQMVALRHIHFKQECNISEISDELGVTNAASSQLLDRLVQQGLIARHEDPVDRRNKKILLTERGQQILRASVIARQHWLGELADHLSPREMEQVTQSFTLLIEKLEQFESA